MQVIIKNKDKYKLIKPANGLSLENFKMTNRLGATGVATKEFGSKWFVTPQGKVLFKNYDLETNALRMINELLYDELAHQIDLPVAKYLPAQINIDNKNSNKNTIYGLASVDVTKGKEKIYDGAKLLDYDDFCGKETFVDYLKALDNFEDGEGYFVDKKKYKINTI